MTGTNQSHQRLIDGDRYSVFFCEDDQCLIQSLNFRSTAGFDVLEHAARVVLGQLQNFPEVALKILFTWKDNTLHGRHLGSLSVHHHAGIEEVGLEQFSVFQSRKGSDWIDGEVQQHLLPYQR
tara:strand:- start:3370 stop:3738 length:369 start_codon:yes stop_codon:yes gene_type:complete